MRTKQRARWIGVAVVAAMLLPTHMAMAMGKPGIHIMSDGVATVVKGTESWVALTYTSDRAIEDVAITVQSRTRGVDIAYPENTADHTSFWTDSALDAGEIDFSAFQVAVGESVQKKSANLRITLTARYAGDDLRGRDQVIQQWTVKVPLVAHSGDDIEQVTEDLGSIPAGESRWVEVAYAGLAPRTNNVSSVVSAPSLTVVYPSEGTQTSLHHDASLEFGETDVVRFLVDTSGVEPGVYEVKVGTTFDGGSIDGVLNLEVVTGT